MATLDWEQVLERVRLGEDEQTELKRWEAFPKKIAAAVCALANSDGGLVVVGVGDSGDVVGVAEDPELVREKLTSLLQSGLNAPVSAALGQHQTETGWVHWIDVRRYRGPEPLRQSGRVLIRRGRASVEASPAELQELFNTLGFVLTEEQIVPGTTASDVDLHVFRDFLERQGFDLDEEPQVDWVQDLANRGAVRFEGEQPQATLYGLMCFGRQPQMFAPTRSAWLEMVAYAGTDRASDVILHGEARGRIDEQVERALGWVKALGNREEYDELHRTDVPLVPFRALREGLVNAVVHRDYAIMGSKVLFEVFSDRIDITSPGELPNHMQVAMALVGGHPRSRNELIANYMTVFRWMELRGRGLPIIRTQMREFNGTEPELLNSRDGRYVRLTLRR
jgi:ATP-dependent DNA helicase RecG